ncbi:hypothetical protein H0H93_013829 [Arthromyces matolae]|nr:hypothetical protein H0H93_013829 [Arthromyces matolae]
MKESPPPPPPPPTPASTFTGSQRRSTRASAADATKNISVVYAAGGMLDSQQDSQAWVEGLVANQYDDIKNLSSPSPAHEALASSDVEIISSSPPTKRPRLTSEEPDTATLAHHYVNQLHSEVLQLQAERDELVENLSKMQQQLDRYCMWREVN